MLSQGTLFVKNGSVLKDLFQKEQEWYALEEKKFNMLLATTKRLLGNFCFFEEAAKKDCTF